MTTAGREPASGGDALTAGRATAPDSAERMLGGLPGVPALGRGPAPAGDSTQAAYHHPAAGWGAAKSVSRVVARSGRPVATTRALLKMNHGDGGFDCPGCAWPDDLNGLRMDFCENGVKHLTWELTGKRVDRHFFDRHTVTELSQWNDSALEDVGRLTEPMAYDPASDRYVPISWADAFALVGVTLRGLDSPHEASFYTSGRLGNEATFLYQLWVREFGTNNLPDCSNMCHEASGRALQASLGTGKGTVDLHDWENTDLIILMGVNAASNAPRMLTALAEAERRGTKIIHINPLVEGAARGTIIPHDVARMATFRRTATSTLNVQPHIGGDLALLRGVAKALLETADHDRHALDHAFLETHTTGFTDYRSECAAMSWSELERGAGVPESTMREIARMYRESGRTIISWCLGLTQHENGVDTIREIVNLLALRGNIGREGAGPSPVRGHSNVQGNRTCGIDHRPSEAFLQRLATVCGIAPPREHGVDTVATIEGMARGQVKVFVGMGGNFALATPDTPYTFAALQRCELTVQVSTKLNRSHLVHGRQALILPCLARSERDVQGGGLQGVTAEDAMSMVRLSTGVKPPISPDLLSEPAIIAGMARATLPDSAVPWEAYVDDYDRIRETMSHVLPGFADFNSRARRPHGFRISQPARERVFHTPSARMEFSLAGLPVEVPADGRLALATVRSHDQWNTTIYSNDDRYRGVRNLRTVVFMNPDDMHDRGIARLELVDITSIAKDGSRRTVYGYRAVPYDIPRGNTAGYMPELNVLCPIGDYSQQSAQPLMKHLRVEIVRSDSANAE